MFCFGFLFFDGQKIQLKEGGFVPEWIEIRTQLDAKTELLRQMVRREIHDVSRLDIDLVWTLFCLCFFS